jgi:hypothetical protein
METVNAALNYYLDDPTSPPYAAAHESIEVRTLVFFPPAA